MPSEKLRYLKQRHGPAAPIPFQELSDHLSGLSSKHLIDLLQVRAQTDDLLRRILVVAVTLCSPTCNLTNATAALDYALHLPDFVRYAEHGHGQVLEEIAKGLEYQAMSGNQDLVLAIGDYSIAQAQKIAEHFEDDRNWTYSLEGLIECFVKMRNTFIPTKLS